MAQYVMTLNGPNLGRRVFNWRGKLIPSRNLSGITDPIVAHPVVLVLGIVAGVFLAKRKKR